RAQGCCQASAGEEGCQEDGAQGCCQAQAGEEGCQEVRAQGCRQAQARQEGCEEDGPQVGCQAQARQEGCEEDGPQVGRQAQARQEGCGQAPSGQEGCQEDREEDRAQGGQASCQEEGGQEGPTSCEAQGCPRGNALRSRTDDVIKTPKAVNHVPSSQPRRRGNFFAYPFSRLREEEPPQGADEGALNASGRRCPRRGRMSALAETHEGPRQGRAG